MALGSKPGPDWWQATAGEGGAISRFSFRYGPLPPDGFGGEGAPQGLSVSISEGELLVVEVRMGGIVVLSRAAGVGLDRDTWLRVTISVVGASVAAYVDGRQLTARVHLPHWEPLRSWQMGLGADGGGFDRYVSGVHLVSSLLLAHAPAVVSLLLNGQQPAVGRLNFTFAAEKVISSLSPRSGPLAASTAVTVYGANLELFQHKSCLLEQVLG